MPVGLDPGQSTTNQMTIAKKFAARANHAAVSWLTLLWLLPSRLDVHTYRMIDLVNVLLHTTAARETAVRSTYFELSQLTEQFIC